MLTSLGKFSIALVTTLRVYATRIGIIISLKGLRKYNTYKCYWAPSHQSAGVDYLTRKMALELPHHNYFNFQIGLLRPVLRYGLVIEQRPVFVC